MAVFIKKIACGDKRYNISVSGKDVYFNSYNTTGGQKIKGVKCYNNELRSERDNKPITDVYLCSCINDTKNSSSGCFITTAVCENLGKADDCDELQALRSFRDNYLLKENNLKNLVYQYYEISPYLVDIINKQQKKDKYCSFLLTEYINKTIAHIDNKDYDNAIKKYKQMIEYIQNSK